MSDSESSPLLASKAKRKAVNQENDSLSENTPLLSSSAPTPRYDGDRDDHEGDAASVTSRRSAASSGSTAKSRTPWPSIIAIVILAALAMSIMFGAFFVPAAVEEYAKQAAVVEPTNLSLESITSNGVRARIQANFRLEGSRVKDDNTRRVGRLATWIVRQLGTEETRVNVYLPDYDNALLGSAVVPPLTVSIVDGHNTAVDIVAELSPGDAESVRTIVNEWLDGKMDYIRLLGKADVSLKSGIIPLGTHSVAESLLFEANRVPGVPQFNISRLVVRDIVVPGTTRKALGADVSITAYNEYPIQVDIPELGFEILVPNCNSVDPYILVATVVTKTVALRPRSDVTVDAEGVIKEIPESLTRACPNSNSSPLDHFLKQYLHGEPATVFVRGKELQNSDTPKWVGELLSIITVPVPFPGRTFDSLIRNFSLSNVDFKLPDPMSDPDDNNTDPTVSGNVEVLAALPSELNVDLNVTKIRSTADIFFKKRKFGELNLRRWQPANSTKIEATEKREALLKIRSRVEDVPLTITDSDIFTELMQALIFGGEEVLLDVSALVDAQVVTVLGKLVLKGVPTKGKIPVKPLPRNAIGSLSPHIGNVKILSTSPTAVQLQALANFTNPTPYTAYIPYMNVHVVKNGSVVGEATAQNVSVVSGKNTNILIYATWDPAMGDEDAPQIGRDLLSQYLSGYNTTVNIKTHQSTIPTAPIIGRALSKLNITVAAPRLSLPGKDEDRERFIRDATFHVFSSTATFTLVSPFQYNTLYIDSVEATAYYNHTEPVGRIEYDEPFGVPPGASETPKLPVDWSVGSVGYEAVKKALGGKLKLDARANVTMRVGAWRETVWYVGRSIGASIRI